MPKVWIDSLRVTHGDAEFADLNRLNPLQVSVTAFNLELDDFYTRSPRNVYRVTARSRLDATFAFSGTFGLDPVLSSGELHIGNFRAQSIADAGPNLLPLDVPHGTLDVNGRYDYALHGATPGLTLDFSDLTLHDVGLRAPGEKDAWVEIPQVQVLDAHVDFLAAQTQVGKLRIVARAQRQPEPRAPLRAAAGGPGRSDCTTAEGVAVGAAADRGRRRGHHARGSRPPPSGDAARRAAGGDRRRLRDSDDGALRDRGQRDPQ